MRRSGSTINICRWIQECSWLHSRAGVAVCCHSAVDGLSFPVVQGIWERILNQVGCLHWRYAEISLTSTITLIDGDWGLTA